MKPKQKPKVNFRKIIAFTLIAVIGISVFLLQNPKKVYSAVEITIEGPYQFGYENKSEFPYEYIKAFYKQGGSSSKKECSFKYLGEYVDLRGSLSKEGIKYHQYQLNQIPSLEPKLDHFIFVPTIAVPLENKYDGYYATRPLGAVDPHSFEKEENIKIGVPSEPETPPETIKGFNVTGLVIWESEDILQLGSITVHLTDLKNNEEIDTYKIILANYGKGEKEAKFEFKNVSPGEYKVWVREQDIGVETVLGCTGTWLGSKNIEVKDSSVDNIELKLKTTSDPLACALTWMVGRIKDMLSGILDWSKQVVNAVVTIPTEHLKSFKGADGIEKNPIVDMWDQIRIICNSLFIIGLLIIAFANVLQLQIDMYAIKAILPRFIAAVILVNFSLIVCRVILDFANILSAAAMKLGSGDISNISGGVLQGTDFGLQKAIETMGLATTALYLATIIFWVIGFIAALLLGGLLLVRVLMVWFLVIVSPIAFLMMVLPFTRGIYSTWWKWYARFIFMGPIVVLILSIGERMASGFKKLPPGFALSAWLLPFFCIAMVLAAFAVPTMLGGAIMAAAVSAAKKTGKWGVKAGAVTPQGRRLSAMWKGYGKRAEARAEREAAVGMFGWKEKLGRAKIGGALGVGMRPEDLESLRKRGGELKDRYGTEELHAMMKAPALTAEQKYNKAAMRYALAEAGESGAGKGWGIPTEKGMRAMPREDVDKLINAEFSQQDQAAFAKQGLYHMIADKNWRESSLKGIQESPEAVSKINREAISALDPDSLGIISAGGVRGIFLYGQKKQKISFLKRFPDLNKDQRNEIIKLNQAGRIDKDIKDEAGISMPTTVIP